MIKKFATFQVLSTMLVPSDAGSASLRTLGHRVNFDYEVRPGFLYVRSRAISSRCNDNYDEFPAEEIKTAYRTFIGKPVFVNHHNDNHRRMRGVCIDAALHEDRNPDGSPDCWAEVLMEVDAVKYPKLAKAIIAGEIDRTSMGTDVAYSLCSICANKASTPAEYCSHIPAMKGKRFYKPDPKTGQKVGVLCREICYGLRFFENSLLVEEPADPTAYFLGVDQRGLSTEASKETPAPDVQPDLPRLAMPGHASTSPAVPRLLPGQATKKAAKDIPNATVHDLAEQRAKREAQKCPDCEGSGTDYDGYWGCEGCGGDGTLQAYNERQSKQSSKTASEDDDLEYYKALSDLEDLLRQDNPHLPRGSVMDAFDKHTPRYAPGTFERHVDDQMKTGAKTALGPAQCKHCGDPIKYNPRSNNLGQPSEHYGGDLLNGWYHADSMRREHQAYPHDDRSGDDQATSDRAGLDQARMHMRKHLDDRFRQVREINDLNDLYKNSAVDMDRNRAAPTGMEVKPDHRYRMIGASGFEDFLTSGQVRARQDTKKNYSAPYFGAAPLERYRQRSAPHDYVAEVHQSKVHDNGGGYEVPHSPLGAGDVTIHRIDNATGASDVVHSPDQPHPYLAKTAVTYDPMPEEHRDAVMRHYLDEGDPRGVHVHYHPLDYQAWRASGGKAYRGGFEMRDSTDHPGAGCTGPGLGQCKHPPTVEHTRQLAQGLWDEDQMRRYEPEKHQQVSQQRERERQHQMDSFLSDYALDHPERVHTWNEDGSLGPAGGGDPRLGAKDDGSFEVPLGKGDMDFMRQMRDAGEMRAQMHEHADKRVVNLADHADLKSHLMEAHGWEHDDFWRNSHEQDHPALMGGSDQDRPLTHQETRDLHDYEHSTEYPHDYPNAVTMGESHFHTAAKAGAMRKGAPFAGYESWDACISQNQDKDSPEGYCATIMRRVEGAKDDPVRPPNAVAYEPHDKEWWVRCQQGHTHYGAGGAAGLLLRHTDEEGARRYFLQKRAAWTDHGGTYSTPGGALHQGESPFEGAKREVEEEMGPLPPIRHSHTISDDHGDWGYHTVVADVDQPFHPGGGNAEHDGGGWFTKDEMDDLPLHPGFKATMAHTVEGKGGKPVGQMNPEEYAVHSQKRDRDKRDGQAWNRRNPVRIKHVVAHWNQATEEEKHSGENWYRDAHEMSKHIAHDTKTPMHTMAGLMSNYSPQTHWAANIQNAAKVARTKTALGGPGDGILATRTQKKAAHRMLQGEHYEKVLSGPKTRAFAHLIEHGENADEQQPRVVIDRHALSVAAGSRATDVAYMHSRLSTKTRYNQVSQTYHKAAKQISKSEGREIHAHQVQAVTWLVRQRLNEAHDRLLSKTAGSRSATAAKTAIAEWGRYAAEHHPAVLGKEPGTGYSTEPEDVQHAREMQEQDTPINKSSALSFTGGYLNDTPSQNRTDYWAEPAGKSPYDAYLAAHGAAPMEPGHGPFHLTRHPQTRAFQVVDNSNRQVLSVSDPGHPRYDLHDHNSWRRAEEAWQEINHAHGHQDQPKIEDAWARQPAPPFEHSTEDPKVAEFKQRAKDHPAERILPQKVVPASSSREHGSTYRPASPEEYDKPGAFHSSSPEDEWHGPYRVIQHAQTGKYHVVDNADRVTQYGGRGGMDEQHTAEMMRDYADGRQQSKEKAKGLAEKIFGGAMDILDPGGTDESRRSERHTERLNDLMHRYQGGEHHPLHPGNFGADDDEHEGDGEGEPYYEVHDPAGSGYSARDYGGPNVHIHHKSMPHGVDTVQAADADPGSILRPGGKAPGFGHEELHQTLNHWVHGNPNPDPRYPDDIDPDTGRGYGMGADHARNEPRIERWQKRNRYTGVKRTAVRTKGPNPGDEFQDGHRLRQYPISGSSGFITSSHVLCDACADQTKPNGVGSAWKHWVRPDDTCSDPKHDFHVSVHGVPEPSEYEHHKDNPQVHAWARDDFSGRGSDTLLCPSCAEDRRSGGEDMGEYYPLPQGRLQDHVDTCNDCGHDVKSSRKEAAMKRTAYGETKAPADVDTLRDEECPVCGESDSYDGNQCQVCGYDAPPAMFQDPDLDLAKQLDLRKDITQGAGELPDQGGLTEDQQDANGGLPGEVPGEAVPGTDEVPIDPNSLGPDGRPLDPGVLDPTALGPDGQPVLGPDGQPVLDLEQGQARIPQGGDPFQPGPNAPVPGQPQVPGGQAGDPDAQDAIDPDALDENGQPVEGEVPAREGEPGTPEDGVGDLVCPNCGFESDAQQPTSIDMDEQSVSADTGDGTLAGDVCPNCGQAQLLSVGEMEEMTGGEPLR